MSYDHLNIEPKWQKFWLENQTFRAVNQSDKPKFYALDMFPYPSGAGLHVGHPLGYTATDIICRKRRHQGYNVLHPMGWDAFGLPAENYAIKTGVHPAVSTAKNIDNFRRQIQSLGFSYDWEREFSTTDPDYYRWSQWIFLQLYHRGLAYEKAMPMNWCPKCKIVAANEEVEDGHHERCGTLVEKKNLKQWMFRITDYAERLLNDLNTPTVHLIHGWEGVGRRGWFNNVIKFCEQEGMAVSALDYPETKEPTYETWKKHFQENAKIWPQDLVIAHSLGNNFIFRYLVEENISLDQLILVAPVKMTDFDLLNTFFDQEFDWEKIQQLVHKITIIYSDNDEYITVSDFEFIADKLNAEKVFLSDRGHFSQSKCDDIPELIDLLRPVAQDVLDWPDKIKAMQRNWIGKSTGCDVDWQVDGHDLVLSTYTTTVDTIYGVTFAVISPEHEALAGIVPATHRSAVDDYIKASGAKSDLERTELNKDKTGVFTGAYLLHPFTGEKVPLYVADYVLMSYGTGVVMGVPAHDQRDMDFAKKYELPIVEAVKLESGESFVYDEVDKYSVKGTLIDSGDFTGLSILEGRKKITTTLEAQNKGKTKVQYKLRDWIFTRQRYWGEPIPLVFDEAGKCYPLDDSELPLVLPETPNYEPSETGESPLAKITDWVNVRGDITPEGTVKISPKGSQAFRRETSTMPNWAGSSWYWLRFMDPHNEQKICSKEAEQYWGPVDLYVGGAEHAVLHLLYGRFWHKVLYDLGCVSTREPFKKLVNQGLIMAEDGTKMSKSVGNVINPDKVVEAFGADTLRCYEMFMGPFEQNKAWSMSSVGGIRKWLDRVERVFAKAQKTKTNNQLQSTLHKTIKQVGEDIDEFKFNTAIAQMMVLTNELTALEKVDPSVLEKFAIILSPFAPHLAEELWEQLGHKNTTIAYEPWPDYDEAYLVEDSITYAIQVNGKVRGQLEIAADADKETVLAAAKDIENVAKWLSEGTIRKEIFVPGKIVGFVVS